MQIMILNGPNLNLLGKRQPELYGHETFEDTFSRLASFFPGISLTYFQTNHEGEAIERLHQAFHEQIQGLVINAGAWTHYSYALHDALRILACPKVEVHISHIFARESFRRVSVLSEACDAMISGLGRAGYEYAIRWILAKHEA
jgi:3-dehydroquinate dehydratase-2